MLICILFTLYDGDQGARRDFQGRVISSTAKNKRITWSFGYRGMGQNMSSFAPECNEAKKKYDECFTAWYDKFLKGESNQNECQAQFDIYQMCVQDAVAKNSVLKQNLSEAREEAPFGKGGASKDA